MSDQGQIVGVLAYLAVLAAITAVAIAVAVAERWRDWRSRGRIRRGGWWGRRG